MLCLRGSCRSSAESKTLLSRIKGILCVALQNVPPNIVANAGCWALHMGVSSNLRYQILNGMDMVGWKLFATAMLSGIPQPILHQLSALLIRVLCVAKVVQVPSCYHLLQVIIAKLSSCVQVLQPRMPSGAFRALTSVVRGANNMVGGISFVIIAKLFGVQKAADTKSEPAPAKNSNKKKSK